MKCNRGVKSADCSKSPSSVFICSLLYSLFCLSMLKYKIYAYLSFYLEASFIVAVTSYTFVLMSVPVHPVLKCVLKYGLTCGWNWGVLGWCLTCDCSKLWWRSRLPSAGWSTAQDPTRTGNKKHEKISFLLPRVIVPVCCCCCWRHILKDQKSNAGKYRAQRGQLQISAFSVIRARSSEWHVKQETGFPVSSICFGQDTLYLSTLTISSKSNPGAQMTISVAYIHIWCVFTSYSGSRFTVVTLQMSVIHILPRLLCSMGVTSWVLISCEPVPSHTAVHR